VFSLYSLPHSGVILLLLLGMITFYSPMIRGEFTFLTYGLKSDTLLTCVFHRQPPQFTSCPDIRQKPQILEIILNSLKPHVDKMSFLKSHICKVNMS
jgi:hypothetical protein